MTVSVPEKEDIPRRRALGDIFRFPRPVHAKGNRSSTTAADHPFTDVFYGGVQIKNMATTVQQDGKHAGQFN